MIGEREVIEGREKMVIRRFLVSTCWQAELGIGELIPAAAQHRLWGTYVEVVKEQF